MSSFELEANFQLYLKFLSPWSSHKESVIFFLCAKYVVPCPTALTTPLFPSLVRYHNMEMKMLKINYLVWQTKKYIQLNFMVLLQRGRNSEGKQHLPRLEKWYFPVADEDIAEGETSGDWLPVSCRPPVEWERSHSLPSSWLVCRDDGVYLENHSWHAQDNDKVMSWKETAVT